MDYEQARFNMIEQQVRTWEVLDQRVLNLLSTVHREDFVPEYHKKLALADVNIPLPHGQVTMTPKVEARLLQAVDIAATDRILEIGTGCAYLTALLGRSGKQVYSVDIFADFTAAAQIKLAARNIRNVSLITGDAVQGWAEHAPYDVIVVTGSIPAPSKPIEQQLAVGGRLFVIIGESPVMEASLVTRVKENEWSRESLFETDIPALIGVKTASKFHF
jgi:protein-L-isoaspartate(D-aspartate) O-methyltransferase